MFNYQRTIGHSVSCFGVGLHTGCHVSITLHPADEDTGIVFKRLDITEQSPLVPACYRNVSNTFLGTTISNSDGVSVATVEHLMAAFWGCGIDNCIIEIDGPEVPIMDGSAEPFVFLIECAGVTKQDRRRKVIEVLKDVRVTEEGDGEGYVSVGPAPEFSMGLEIDYGDSVIKNQKALFDLAGTSFKSDLCRARTFGFAHEVDILRERGLAKGGSLENAVVVGQEGVVNQEGLRYFDEFVRHKVLDYIGDVYLAGAHLKGHFHGFKSGHALNNKLLHALFADKDAWREVRVPEHHEAGFMMPTETASGSTAML